MTTKNTAQQKESKQPKCNVLSTTAIFVHTKQKTINDTAKKGMICMACVALFAIGYLQKLKEKGVLCLLNLFLCIFVLDETNINADVHIVLIVIRI